MPLFRKKGGNTKESSSSGKGRGAQTQSQQHRRVTQYERQSSSGLRQVREPEETIMLPRGVAVVSSNPNRNRDHRGRSLSAGRRARSGLQLQTNQQSHQHQHAHAHTLHQHQHNQMHPSAQVSPDDYNNNYDYPQQSHPQQKHANYNHNNNINYNHNTHNNSGSYTNPRGGNLDYEYEHRDSPPMPPQLQHVPSPGNSYQNSSSHTNSITNSSNRNMTIHNPSYSHSSRTRSSRNSSNNQDYNVDYNLEHNLDQHHDTFAMEHQSQDRSRNTYAHTNSVIPQGPFDHHHPHNHNNTSIINTTNNVSVPVPFTSPPRSPRARSRSNSLTRRGRESHSPQRSRRQQTSNSRSRGKGIPNTASTSTGSSQRRNRHHTPNYPFDHPGLVNNKSKSHSSGTSTSRSSTDVDHSASFNGQPRERDLHFNDNAEISYDRFGEPEVLRICHNPPNMGMRSGAVIEVEASTICISDCLLRRNMFPHTQEPTTLPQSPGVDCVGRIVHAGDLVERYDGFRVGDRVCSLYPFLGGNARYLTLPAPQLIRVPERVDAAQAACIIRSYVAAHQILHRVGGTELKIRRGHRVLVTGANGQIGRAVVELARLAGASEIHASARWKHRQFITSVLKEEWLPPDPAKWEHLQGEIDIVVDTVCFTGYFDDALKVLKPSGGKVVCVGTARETMRSIQDQKEHYAMMTGRAYDRNSHDTDGDDTDGEDGETILSEIQHDPLSQFPFACNLQSFKARFFMNKRTFKYDLFQSVEDRPDEFRKDLSLLFGYLDQLKLNPIVTHRVPLVGVRRAHKELEKGGFQGTMVCTPWKITKKKKANTDPSIRPLY